MVKIGSLFDGSGGFPLAGAIHGAMPVWSSEVEPYPIAVTRSRFPGVKHLGNVCEINGAEIEPVDIITFGSPCQDLSVAGKRAGLEDGKRSNLFYQSVRIIKEMRDKTNGVYPRIAVWENVPGAFSSAKGADFQAVIQSLAEIADKGVSVPRSPGKWTNAGDVVGNGFSIAWRTLDAQYWGVPQRRRRIYLVADFGSERAGEILFERESVSGDTAQGREAREGTAADAEGRADGSCIPINLQIITRHNALGRGTGFGAGDDGDAAYTLQAGHEHGVVYPAVARTLEARHDSSPCIDRGQNFICYDMRGNDDGRTVNTITGDHENRPTDYSYIIRRLTPTECRRLQGFPDGWGELAPFDGDVEFWEGVRKTHAEINGKTYKPLKDIKKWYDKLHTDSAEYKMWGNAIAVPCAAFVLGNIIKELEKRKNA